MSKSRRQPYPALSQPRNQWRGQDPPAVPVQEPAEPTTAAVESEYQDTCRNCGEQFTLTARAREVFEQKGLSLPRRCFQCRTEARNSPRLRGVVVKISPLGWGIIESDGTTFYFTTRGVSNGRQLKENDRVVFALMPAVKPKPGQRPRAWSIELEP